MRGDNSDSAVSVNSRLVRNRGERHIGRIEVCSISIHFMKYSMQVVTQAHRFIAPLFCCWQQTVLFFDIYVHGIVQQCCYCCLLIYKFMFSHIIESIIYLCIIHFTHNVLIMGLSSWKI